MDHMLLLHKANLNMWLRSHCIALGGEGQHLIGQLKRPQEC